MEKIIVLTETEAKNMLQNAVRDGLTLFEQEKAKGNNEKLMSINKVAKRLGKSHSTIKKLIKNGLLKATSDMQISEKAVNNYLQTV